MPTPRTVVDTAKDVLAVKVVTSQPDFWKGLHCGTRETPLSHLKIAEVFLPPKELESTRERKDLTHIKTTSVRERAFNKILHQLVKRQHYKQVLILGSGFDVRAVKKSKKAQSDKRNAAVYQTVKFWEVDNEQILKEKEEGLLKAGYDTNASYIPGDYTKLDLPKVLKEKNFKLDQPTLIIFEGNLMYLSEEQIDSLFTVLKENLDHFVIALDFFPQTFIDFIKAHSQPNSNESMWQSGIDDLSAFAERYGLNIILHENVANLSKVYQVDEAPGRGVDKYQLCVLSHATPECAITFTK